jgi:hypothetical protein
MYKKSFRESSKRKKKQSFPLQCNDEMDFQECELAILRQAVDNIEDNTKRQQKNSDDIVKMIQIVEMFLRDTKCICYGGIAINNILPQEAQFYNQDVEIPDYDFYSKTPIDHAKDLADRFYKAGYAEVEAKAGVHYGTYKVFVNFIPMADITMLHTDLYDNLQKESMEIQGIHYSSPNFLRMNMYLELSRPDGDVSRWEKVLKRITLLNKHYPMNSQNCHEINFQRELNTQTLEDSSKLYYIVRDSLIDQKVIFFGGYAGSLYSKYTPDDKLRMIKQTPDFDAISENPELCASIVIQKLNDSGFSAAKLTKHDAIGEIIPSHYEITVDDETLGYIYQPIACHNYNEIMIDKRSVRVATIDTILSFYLAFLFSNHAHEDHKYKDRLLCMAKFLFDLGEKNRLSQVGLLKRFSLQCYGKQPTIESIRAKKAEMFRKLHREKDKNEWEKWFLKHNPANLDKKRKDPKVASSSPLNSVLSSSSKRKKSKTKSSSEKTSKRATRKKSSIMKKFSLSKKSEFLF